MPFSTDPKDAKERKKGTLDRTLEVNANLVVNFHRTRPPTRAQVQFLEDAHFIAKRALLGARVVVLDMLLAILTKGPGPARTATTDSKNELKPALYDTFTKHLHFPDLSDRTDWSAWKADLQTVREVFAADCQYLLNRVTVGDTYRLVVNPHYAKVSDPGLIKKLKGDGTAPEGFVNLKKAAWEQIDKNPTLLDEWTSGRHKFPPDEWGNIKVDFGLLCKVCRLQIAGTLIHESTHKMKNAVDHCYASDSGSYKTLTKAQAMDNADSYAFTAISLYKMTYIKNDKKLAELGTAKTIDVQS